MINFFLHPKDDPSFILKIHQIVVGMLSAYPRDDIYLICVNNWFSGKWLGFSGKVSRTFGVTHVKNNKDVTIPPFHPHRIVQVSQYFWSEEVDEYLVCQNPPEIHYRQQSQQNLRRRLSEFSESAALVWYSTNTIHNSMGSLMVYSIEKENVQYWYCGLAKNQIWRAVQVTGNTFACLNQWERGGKIVLKH